MKNSKEVFTKLISATKFLLIIVTLNCYQACNTKVKDTKAKYTVRIPAKDANIVLKLNSKGIAGFRIQSSDGHSISDSVIYDSNTTCWQCTADAKGEQQCHQIKCPEKLPGNMVPTLLELPDPINPGTTANFNFIIDTTIKTNGNK